MEDRHQVTLSTLCFIRNKEKLLLVEFSKEKGEMQGFYNAPGGHLEANEGIIECARKEILEETGLELEDIKFKGVVHISNFFGKNVMAFITLSETNQIEVIESSEGKLHWVNIDKIDELNAFEDIKIILNKINNMEEGEVFTAKSQFDGKEKLVKMEFE